MAKARFADGLRKGSTKSKTFSTLPTRKEGRVQIIKDRVYDVANPQSDAQMLQRVCFATASSAAAKMLPIISISQEGESNPEYARQLFVSQNTDFLKKAAYKRVGLARHYRAAYAPRGNQVLIPNSYQVSKGSLVAPQIFVPKTGVRDGGGSFQYATFGEIGVPGDTGSYNSLVELTVGETYDAARMWADLFGLIPGDQITFPQIYGDGIAQALYSGDTEESGLEDKTLNTVFCAPRLVLKKEMPAATITIGQSTTMQNVADMLESGIDAENSYSTLVENFIGSLELDELAEDVMNITFNGTYGSVFGVNGSENLRALGVILSRYDSERQKWQYSTSNLVCVWDFLSQNSGADYFGFTIDNAIDTYRAGVSQNENGNFLQRGGTPDIVPASFT